MNHRDSLMHLQKPKVGIYWVVKNELVFDMLPTEKAEPYGDALQHGGHYEWHKSLVPETRSERLLKRLPYEYWPRGRIVYFMLRNVYRIYISPRISQGVITEIVYLFGLMEQLYEIEYDDHYN
jgi:hypothetical protein